MKRNSMRGFTFIGLMIVIGIIGIMVAIAIPLSWSIVNRVDHAVSTPSVKGGR